MNINDVAFVELFKEHIINLLVKLDGMKFNDALLTWYRAYTDYNEKVYQVIKYILKHTKGKCRTLLNRNPTIKYGSFLAMEIANVKQDYDDLSAGLPIQCLSSLNADLTYKVHIQATVYANPFNCWKLSKETISSQAS